MLVSVAVPVPFLDALTYAVPVSLQPPVLGARVRVPVGRRLVTGCVVGVNAEAPVAAVKTIDGVLDTEAVVLPELLDLCRWISEYYVAGLGDAIQLALPPGSVAGNARVATTRTFAVTKAGLGARESQANRGDAPGLTPQIGRAHV